MFSRISLGRPSSLLFTRPDDMIRGDKFDVTFDYLSSSAVAAGFWKIDLSQKRWSGGNMLSS